MLKDNLIFLRNYKGISLEDIAGIIGISRQAYAKCACINEDRHI